MKSKQCKKAVSSALSFFLIVLMIFSIPVPHVFAQSNTFTGTEALEVEEHEKVDLLDGIAAASPRGEALQITVKDVICETDESYQYDDSGILDVGEAGSVYQIEYEAAASSNTEEIYSATREITAVPKENPPVEETPEAMPEGSPEAVPEEKPEETPETAPEEKPEETPEAAPEEKPEETPETVPEENTDQVNKIVIIAFEELSEEITEQWVTKENAAENLVLPKELNATDENGQTILVENIVWEHEKLNSENQDQERYLFTAKLPEGYVLVEGVTMPTITVIVEGATGTQILFENGIHYIIDPQYPDKKITLFCMNNKLHWPHHTEDMGEIQVPGYTDGYLTPDDFKSQKDYEECMRRLSKLLYAGYPYNGERLYQIVTNSSEYAPTEAEFNQMLIVPPVLQTAYPYLGHHKYTYADWKTQNKEHLEEIRKFTEEVIKLNIHGGTTSNGLTYADIAAMPFYKAAFSITNCNSGTPLTTFQFFYGASYFVTEEEAYNATQDAVWHLLWEYDIPDNNLNTMSLPLSQVLYTYSERGGLLDYQPSISDIKLSGDLTFHYNPTDGMWHSSPLRLIEPDEYRGLYRLELPKGITALCDNLTYVYGDEEYELVSDHQPTEGESFGIRAEFVWLEEFKQYSPSPDIEFEGKKFQHMIGAVIHNETLTANIPIAASQIGEVSITKNVIGEKNCPTEFQFEMKLPYHQGISGKYGDMEFNRGVAKFSLKAGETKTARYLPAGAHYVIKELNSTGYHVGSIDSEGDVPISDVRPVTFTNTKLPDLTLAKKVTGEMGDKTKAFEFVIELEDKNQTPVNGSFDYIGGVVEGTGAKPPEEGTITFTNGKAQISLSHGQKITIKDLPHESTYTVTETTDAKDPYTVTYNGEAQKATGQLNTDASIEVVNKKESVPPTGITNHTNHSTGIGVAIALGGLCVLFGFGLFRRRRGWKK